MTVRLAIVIFGALAIASGPSSCKDSVPNSPPSPFRPATSPSMDWQFGLDTPNVQFQYGRTNQFTAVASGSQGNVYAVAEAWASTLVSDTIAAVFCFNESGQLLWRRDHDVAGKYDEARSIVVTPSGDLVIAGMTWTGNNGVAWLWRLSPDGSSKWFREYPYGSGYWSANLPHVVVLPNGSTALIDEVTDSVNPQTNRKVWILPVNDANGAPGGGHTIPAAVALGVEAAVVNGPGLFLLTTSPQPTVIRTDDLETAKWSRSPTPGSVTFKHLRSLAPWGNGVVVAGGTRLVTNGLMLPWVVAIDDQGVESWNKVYSEARLPDGNLSGVGAGSGVIVASGSVCLDCNNRPNNRDATLIGLQPDGSLAWVSVMSPGTNDNDAFYDVETAGTDHVIAAGVKRVCNPQLLNCGTVPSSAWLVGFK